ncbi:MAG TPA: DUF1264 domain-containing protein [Nitrospiraceae bacterium]|jgi:hypothetical protein|nr:DUF1264 domain-containing protein [Nitrospiraceae bacterium]
MRNGVIVAITIGVFGCGAVAPQHVGAEPKSPVDGYDIHVQAPHMMHDGTVGGPYHHYCKGISDKILQCLLFKSTDPQAQLIGVEYFVAKELSRKLPPIKWHRHFHDHKVEIATGRVQVLEPADKAKEIAEAASNTDGVIYHLWQEGQEFPDGTVTFPQSLGHTFTGHSERLVSAP